MLTIYIRAEYDKQFLKERYWWSGSGPLLGLTVGDDTVNCLNWFTDIDGPCYLTLEGCKQYMAMAKKNHRYDVINAMLDQVDLLQRELDWKVWQWIVDDYER